MAAIRILHVDDEADIREVIEISLGLDPDFVVRSCESGAEGLTVAAQWNPDLILLDVMMPVMDGPATLLALRENSKTANVPVIFMTARAQPRELDRFRSLGAVGVIAKPFDPMTLAASVRDYLQPAPDPLADLRASFLQRVRRNIAALAEDHAALKRGDALPHTLEWIRDVAHSLSGAGGSTDFRKSAMPRRRWKTRLWLFSPPPDPTRCYCTHSMPWLRSPMRRGAAGDAGASRYGLAPRGYLVSISSFAL